MIQDSEQRIAFNLIRSHAETLFKRMDRFAKHWEDCTCKSPAETRYILINLIFMEHLKALFLPLVDYLECSCSMGPDCRELPRVAQHVFRVAMELETLDAKAFGSDFNPPLYTKCQIDRIHNQNYRISHRATRFGISRGSETAIDDCGGPLRTDEEIALGMCGTCLAKYGSYMGRGISGAPV